MLGVKDIYTESNNKITTYNEWLKANELSPESVAYMGDDIPDYEVMQAVGMACCPRDAATDIQRIARYISPYKGGEGCVRDLIEQTLRAQGHWLNSQHSFDW